MFSLPIFTYGNNLTIMKRLLIAILAITLSFTALAAKTKVFNRYAMELTQQKDGTYTVWKAFIPLLKGDEPEGVYTPYKIVSPIDDDSIADVDETEVVYKKYGSYDLKLYICRAKSSTPTPVVFFCHGGSWTDGSPASMRPFAKYMAKFEGITTVNVQYTLSKQEGADIDRSIEDYMDAIKYVRKHAKELNVDSKRLGFVGHSAGGHLSAVAAMLCPQSRVFVGWAGVYNFCTAACTQTLYRGPKYDFLARYFHNLTDGELARVSPVNMIPKKPHCAVQLFYGGCDRHVGVEQATEYGDKLRKAGYTVDMQYYRYYAHNIHYRSDKNREVLAKTIEFIKKHI